MPPPAARDANWIDGLRGMASFTVVMGHLCTSFMPILHAPARSDHEGPMLLQLPFLRLCVGGRSAVALFFLITGYVNSMGPLAKARTGNVEAAFSSLAKSALTRPGRLVLPVAIATVFSWLLANLHAYDMTKHVDATWIRQGWHGAAPSLREAITSLLKAEVSTWTTGWDEYDGTQWTLRRFLLGSLMVYATVLATMLVTPRARKMVLALLYLYGWLAGDAICLMNVVMGMLIAEVQNDLGSAATSVLGSYVPPLMIILGLFMCGYPQNTPEWAPWSRFMHDIMTPITPENADIRRYWDSLGAGTVIWGVFFSRTGRRVLSSPVFNFLGRVSFPVYLLHNQFIKSVLTWMVYTNSYLHPPVDKDGKQLDLVPCGPVQFVVALLVFYALLYRTALFWTQHIDPLCASAVKWATTKAYGDGSVAEKPILGT